MIIKDHSAKPFGDVFAVNEVADFDPRDHRLCAVDLRSGCNIALPVTRRGWEGREGDFRPMIGYPAGIIR